MRMFHCQSLKENRESVSTLAENRAGNSPVSKGYDQIERAATTGTSDFVRVSENDFNVCKQISLICVVCKCVSVISDPNHYIR